MRNLWRSPVVLTGNIMAISALVFLFGYVLRLPYFKNTELGWIITTLIGAAMVLGFGYLWSWKDSVNTKKRLK